MDGKHGFRAIFSLSLYFTTDQSGTQRRRSSRHPRTCRVGPPGPASRDLSVPGFSRSPCPAEDGRALTMILAFLYLA